MIDLEKRVQRKRRSYYKALGAKLPESLSGGAIDNYEYRIVPNSWRNTVPYRERRAMLEINSPLVYDLMRGKTLLVDIELGKRADHPYRHLYPYFTNRGFRFRAHMVDDVNNEKYRRLLLWIEPYKAEKFKKAA